MSDVFNKLLENSVNNSIFASHTKLKAGSTGSINGWASDGLSEYAPL